MSLRKGWMLLAILGTNVGHLSAEPCDCTALIERLHLLEQRVESLESRLGGAQPPVVSDQTDPVVQVGTENPPIETASPRLRTPSVAPAPLVDERGAIQTPGLPRPNQAKSGFYLLRDAGSRPTGDPDAAGLVPFEGRVSFQPRDYGLETGGLFSEYDDPSLYPAVAVNLAGQWRIGQAGVYRLVVRPKPSREGASAVRGTMIFSVRVDGRAVIPETRTQSWRKHEREVELSAGSHRVEIDALARSPGFGPSPTDSQLWIGVRGPGEAAPRPLVLTAP